jgi:hypothetical protein
MVAKPPAPGRNTLPRQAAPCDYRRQYTSRRGPETIGQIPATAAGRRLVQKSMALRLKGPCHGRVLEPKGRVKPLL